LLEEIKPPETKPLETVAAEITSTLQQKEAESLTFQVANDAYEGIIAAGSFAQYAKANPKIHIQESSFFTKNSAPAELKTDAQFMDKAFELNKGELSSLIKGQSGYAILFAEDIKEPEIPAFETKKDLLVKDYQKVQSGEMAEKAAKDMLQSLHEGKKIDALAQEQGFTVLESGLLSRREQNSTAFPASLTEDVFLLAPASPLPEAPGKVGDDFFVYSFLDKQIPAMSKNSAEVVQYRENLLRFKQQQLLSAWLRHMEADAKITQHQSL
jgi:peptidyl-prolyl cis-trans isomerase D